MPVVWCRSIMQAPSIPVVRITGLQHAAATAPVNVDGLVHPSVFPIETLSRQPWSQCRMR
jgi:hypothetical protein